MKIKAGVNFHNRFDIVKNGEWVGYAENIILNQMYNRICNFNSYFVNIHFGTGSGTLTPDRTSLFNHLGTKTAVVEETIKALPTSKVTKKIVLMPEEYVGQTITEVGVAYGSSASNLVTHAMIKDAEGNPLSIEKTGIDVIEIYATIFVTLIDSNGVTFFNESIFSTKRESNVLFEYLISERTSLSPTIMLESHNREDRMPYISTIAKKTPSVSVNTANRTRTYSVRFGVDEANYGASIYSVSLEGICRKVLNIAHTLSGHIIGVGDGVQDTFEIPHSITNPVIKVNGSINTDNIVTVFDEPNHRISPMLFAEELFPEDYQLNVWAEPYADYSVTFEASRYLVSWKNKVSLRGKTLTMQMRGRSSDLTSHLELETSEDGSNWTTRLTLSGTYTAGLRERQILVDWDDLYYRLRAVNGFREGNLWIEPDESKISKVVFNTPPAIDDVITIDGTLPYYPKDENYVVDVTFELQFGEGAMV